MISRKEERIAEIFKKKFPSNEFYFKYPILTINNKITIDISLYIAPPNEYFDSKLNFGLYEGLPSTSREVLKHIVVI